MLNADATCAEEYIVVHHISFAIYQVDVSVCVKFVSPKKWRNDGRARDIVAVFTTKRSESQIVYFQGM